MTNPTDIAGLVERLQHPRALHSLGDITAPHLARQIVTALTALVKERDFEISARKEIGAAWDKARAQIDTAQSTLTAIRGVAEELEREAVELQRNASDPVDGGEAGGLCLAASRLRAVLEGK